MTRKNSNDVQNIEEEEKVEEDFSKIGLSNVKYDPIFK